MNHPKTLIRSLAMKFLFQELTDYGIEGVRGVRFDDIKKEYLLFVESYIQEDAEHFDNSAEDKVLAKGEIYLKGIFLNLSDLMTLIKNSSDRTLEKIDLVNLAILLVATYELKYLSTEVPPKVAINEAIELSKGYSTQDSSGFINSILDKISKQSRE